MTLYAAHIHKQCVTIIDCDDYYFYERNQTHGYIMSINLCLTLYSDLCNIPSFLKLIRKKYYIKHCVSQL